MKHSTHGERGIDCHDIGALPYHWNKSLEKINSGSQTPILFGLIILFARFLPTIDLGGFDTVPRGGIGWRHVFGDVDTLVDNAFVTDGDAEASRPPQPQPSAHGGLLGAAHGRACCAMVYKHDSGLRFPYEDKISALIHEPSFQERASQAVFTKAKLIIRIGNRAVHETRDTSAQDATDAVRELFHLCFWLAHLWQGPASGRSRLRRSATNPQRRSGPGRSLPS